VLKVIGMIVVLAGYQVWFSNSKSPSCKTSVLPPARLMTDF